MPLKTLVIDGFKSFADKTELHFDQGLTGIVGPNGSGKSNITEAIRWVMGEQSAKSLRGDHMPDVIFSGSQIRPALNRAQVTLIFDNEHHQLSDPHPEVMITRRLFRDGTSDFEINHHAVRLKDIADLFLDSGLGKSAFAIISQGRVETILNSKPEDRRIIIEEAAGIFKYKLQKQQAQRELATTTDNLERVSDIVVELKRQVEPLQQQASMARDFQQQQQRQHLAAQHVLTYRIAEGLQQQQETQAKHQQLAQQKHQLDTNFQTLEQNFQSLKQIETDLLTQEQHHQQQVQVLHDKIIDLKQQLALNEERQYHQSSSYEELKNQLSHYHQQITDTTTARDHHQLQAEKIHQQVSHHQQQVTRLKKEITGGAQHLEDTIERQRAEYLELLQQQTSLRNDLTYNHKEQQRLDHELARQRQVLEQSEDLTEQPEYVNLQTAVSTNQAQLDHLQQQQKDLQQQQVHFQEQMQTIQQHWYQKLGVLQQQKGELASQEALQRDHAGFYNGVRAILKAPKLKGIVGPIADLLIVPSPLQTAIEQALGSQLQFVVTQTQNHAQDAISFLKQHQAGRVTFLPQDVIQPKTFPNSLRQKLAEVKGFVGIAADLVTANQKNLHSILEHLLGQIILTKNLDSGTVIANLVQHRYKIVTLAGDIINPGGSMTGGSIRATTHILNRQQKIEELTQVVQITQADVATSEQKLQAVQQKLAEVNKQRDYQEKLVAQVQQTLQKQQQKLQTWQLKLDYQQRQVATYQLAHKRLTQELENLVEQQQSLSAQLKQTEMAANKKNDQLHLDQQNLNDFEHHRHDLEQELAAEQTTLAVLKTQDEHEKAELIQLTEQLTQAQVTLSKLQQRQNQLVNSQQLQHTSKADLKKQLLQQQSGFEQLTNDLKKVTTKLAEVRHQKDQVLPDLEHLQQQQQVIQANLETYVAKLSALKSQLTQDLESLGATYHLTFEAAWHQTSVSGYKESHWLEEVKLTQLALDDLGEVNPLAIDQYEQVRQRFEFLSQQQADLLAAKAQLEQTMTTMDHEVSTRFMTTFNAVAQAFSAIFPEMFGGGHAALKLTDSQHPLTTGISIEAQPPGKKLQQLTLLSGGERALTAITLLFAILKVKPIPFSILDEVEASLDETNVSRFARFLKHYETQTQFIIITHRKGTMQEVDNLYGITMDQSGVSQVLTVNLQDIKWNEG